ncbi:MAG: hypothetical protein Q8M92_07535 [Candidatus Subteraquimicrobiales bacterium]|nr:hypothetical protein [Candidatus Subteraquimicrobiales bacterium]
MSTSADGQTYTSVDILGGDNLVIYVGPPTKPPSGVTAPEPGDDDGGTTDAGKFKLVGLCQNLNIGTNRPQRQVPELGSSAKYIVSSRGSKQGSMARIITDGGSVLYCLYKYYRAQNPAASVPNGKIWISIDDPIFKQPIGLMFRIMERLPSGELSQKETIYLEDVTISSIGQGVNEGDRGYMDTLTFTWTETK